MDHYKHKFSFNEVLDMPNRLFHTLYISLTKKLATDSGKKELADKALTDSIEEEVNI